MEQTLFVDCLSIVIQSSRQDASVKLVITILVRNELSLDFIFKVVAEKPPVCFGLDPKHQPPYRSPQP